MGNKLHKMVRLTQRDIAVAAGISASAMSLIVRRLRRADPETAAKLERATGIDRRAWCWPDEFENPMIK